MIYPSKIPAYIRVGEGYDIHRFEVSRPLFLGGIKIADSGGLSGHSDADVLIHAIMDALLGAAGLPDIGHFSLIVMSGLMGHAVWNYLNR